RARLLAVALGTFRADGLPDLSRAEGADQPRAEHQAHEERGQECHRRPEGDVAEDVEEAVVLLEPGEERQHRVPPGLVRAARSASRARSMRMPREPFTSTRSPGPSLAATCAAAASGASKLATSEHPASRAASAPTRMAGPTVAKPVTGS